MTMHLHELVVTSAGGTLVDVHDLRIEPGQPLTIVGESGSGKSLLAHAIMGTLAAELGVRGRLTADGVGYDLADATNRRKAWGRVLSLLPQEPVLALDPTMRIRSQVAEGARRFRTDRRDTGRRADGLLASLGVGGFGQAFPHTLSGGMAQRVAFAAATIGGAQMLIADEPSKGLDERSRSDLAQLLRRHIDADGVLLTSTHDLDLARELGGEVVVMKDATLIERGPATQVLTQPTQPYTRRLLAAEPGRWNHAWMRHGSPHEAAGTVLVQAEGIAKSFDHGTLFEDLSVTVRTGQRLAVHGPSGSGKTTLGNILLRLLSPDRGRVRHADELGGGRRQKLYQDPALAFPARVRLRASFDDVVRRHRLDAARLDELVGTFRLAPPLLDRRPGQVSGGELQRLAIIRAMLLEPALIFADEPTSRLDLLSQEETMCALMEQVDRQDCALLLVTHSAALADAVAGERLRLDEQDQPDRLPAPSG